MSKKYALLPFLQLLNREADAGQTAMQTLKATPVSQWTERFARPGWRSYGIFRAMLAYAREELDRNPRMALSITTFVTDHVDDLQPIPESVILAPFIRGLAWKEHANALYAAEKYPASAAAADKAIVIFGSEPALAVDLGAATLVRAMSLHQQKQTVEALELVTTCVRLFAEHAQPLKYLVSLQVCGLILFDLEEYAAARDAYQVALDLADEQNKPREHTRILNNIGQCNVCLGELELGEQQLQQAFRQFSQHQMESEMLRAVAGLAKIMFKQGKLEQAAYAFHGVYAEFLHQDMMIPAAQVLVELTDIVTQLTGDVIYARNECARLAETFGDYDVPGNVREAVAFVRQETAAARSVEQVRSALAYVRKFLNEELLGSPSAAFAAPA